MSAWENSEYRQIVLRWLTSYGIRLTVLCHAVDTDGVLGETEPLASYETNIVRDLAAEALVDLEVVSSPKDAFKMFSKWNKISKASRRSSFAVNVGWCDHGPAFAHGPICPERVGWLVHFVNNAFPELVAGLEVESFGHVGRAPKRHGLSKALMPGHLRMMFPGVYAYPDQDKTMECYRDLAELMVHNPQRAALHLVMNAALKGIEIPSAMFKKRITSFSDLWAVLLLWSEPVEIWHAVVSCCVPGAVTIDRTGNWPDNPLERRLAEGLLKAVSDYVPAMASVAVMGDSESAVTCILRDLHTSPTTPTASRIFGALFSIQGCREAFEELWGVEGANTIEADSSLFEQSAPYQRDNRADFTIEAGDSLFLARLWALLSCCAETNWAELYADFVVKYDPQYQLQMEEADGELVLGESFWSGKLHGVCRTMLVPPVQWTAEQSFQVADLTTLRNFLWWWCIPDTGKQLFEDPTQHFSQFAQGKFPRTELPSFDEWRYESRIWRLEYAGARTIMSEACRENHVCVNDCLADGTRVCGCMSVKDYAWKPPEVGDAETASAFSQKSFRNSVHVTPNRGGFCVPLVTGTEVDL